MPELPEVETVRTALEPVVTGQQIRSVRLTRGDLRWPLPERLDEILTGQICGMPWRRGKYILLPLSGQQTLLIHLGMSGAIRIYDNCPDSLANMIIFLSSWQITIGLFFQIRAVLAILTCYKAEMRRRIHCWLQWGLSRYQMRFHKLI